MRFNRIEKLNRIIKYVLLSLVVVGVVFGLIYKASNPNDYRHPRDRSIQLH